MRSPGFWYPDPQAPRFQRQLARGLLSPFAYLYGLGARIKRRMTVPERPSIPVICVGNFTAGGAGKTPVSLAIADRLKRMGETPYFLSRGYGGTEAGPLQVDADTHASDQVGDEPLLLAQSAPTWISKDRPMGAFAAEAAGASVLVMDDGFQNPSLHKDLSLIVIDSGVGLGNRAVIPAGPLRERLSDGLARADALVLIGDGPFLSDMTALAAAHGLHCLSARLTTTEDNPDIRDQPCVAFAGIGRPQKFFETVVKSGGTLVGRHPFADHADLTDAEAQSLLNEADKHKALLVTTAKDHMRLMRFQTGPQRELRDRALVLNVSATFEDEAALDQLLRTHLEAARASHTYAPPGTRRNDGA